MIKWAPYIFVRITICFGAGILWQIYGGYLPGYLPAWVAFFCGLCIGLHLLGSKLAHYFLTQLAGLTGLFTVFLFGNLITEQRTQTNQPDHLIHQKQAIRYYTGVVNDFVVEKPRHYNIILRVNRVRLARGWRPVTGNVLLMLRKEAGQLRPQYGQVMLVQGAPAEPAPPLNPAAFNYRRYLARQQIYHQQYVWPPQVKVIGVAPPNLIMALGIRLRNQLDAVLKQYVPGARNYAIATALVLGIKEYLDADIKAAYTRTGTTHVLAVSGLHVALLFLFLNILLSKLARTRRQKLIVFLLLIGVMWLYALVTALSASVLRAVVMFSLLSGAKFFRRRSNMYNVLAGTAFVLLVWNPYFLLDVGFQLSFAAVVGIVFWQPRFSQWLTVDNWLGRKLWEGLTASLAAQLATAPLALYYFHQFPVYFLVANLFAVIISEGILAVGFGLLAFSWVPYAGVLLGRLMGALLDLMNAIVLLIEKLPHAIIDGISFTLGQAWLIAAFLLLASWFILYRKRVFLGTAALALLLFAGWQLSKENARQNQQLWVVYHLKGKSGLAFIQGRRATLLADSALQPPQTEFTYNIQPHWWQLGVADTKNIPLSASGKSMAAFTTPASNTCLVWHGLRILLVEHPEQFTSLTAQPISLDYILVRRNVRLDVPQLRQVFRFKSLIADASNARWYVRRLQETCAGQQIPFYDVSKQGAFVYRW